MHSLLKRILVFISLILFFNFQSFSVNIHNLHTGSFTGPNQVTPGMTFDMYYDYYRTNFNGTTSNITFAISTYISEDQIYQPGVDILLATKTIVNLPPTTIENGGVVYNVTFPSNLTMPTGRLYYITILDVTNVIVESDETDNISSSPFYYTKPGTDAAAISITNTKSEYTSSQPIITLDATIINSGSTDLSNLEYAVIIGTNASDISQSVYSKKYTIPTISTSKIEMIQTQLVDLFPLNLPNGNYFIFLQIDPDNILTETNETNNIKSVPFVYTNSPVDPNPIFLMNTSGHQTIQTCNALLYDDGGPNGKASYGVNGKLKIYPSGTNNKVTITLNNLDIWDFDALYIYDAAYGTTPVRTFKKDSPLNTITSTYTSKALDGAIEVQYVTDPFSNYPGFKASITCTYENPSLTSQSITFNTLPTKTMLESTFTLSGIASSNLAVSYQSTNSEVATITNNIVTIVGPGTTSIIASQAGDASYKAAVDAIQILTVTKESQTITFDPFTPTVRLNDPNFNVTATSSSGLPVTFVSSNTNVVTVTDNNTITIIGAGTATITAQQIGNNIYTPATSVVKTIIVSKLDQLITFDNIDKVFGNAAFTLTASVNSGLPITYSISTNTAATLSGNTVTIIAAGTASITATQAGNSIYNAATVTKILTVAKAPQTISFAALSEHAIGDPAFTLTAISSSGLVVTFISNNTSLVSVSGTTATILGQGIATLSAQQAGNTNYLPATDVIRTLVIDKTTKISFDWAKVTTLAGNGTRGTLDGTGTAATFSTPYGIVCDKSNNVYVSDQYSGLIRKITPAGEVTTLAGSTSGFANGTGSAAKFDWPSGMTIDTAGNIYVADQNNHRIRKITPDGEVTTFMGTGTNDSANGPLSSATVSYPTEITIDALGNLYVGAANRIRKITPLGNVSTWAGSGNQGFGNGTSTNSAVKFLGISGLTVDPSGNVFVVDANTRVRTITPTTVVVSTYAGSTIGYIDGPSALAKFASPRDVLSDASGNIFVADVSNDRIRLISTDGLVSTIAGNGGAAYPDYLGANAILYGPTAMCLDKLNNLYVTNQFRNTISKISPVGLSPFKTASSSASDVQLFYVSGNDLTENLLVTAPIGYEISFDQSTGFANSLSVIQSAGIVTSTPIYIRLSATAIAGNYNGTIDISSAGAYNKSYTVTGIIIDKINQTISFEPIDSKKINDTNFNLTATASSELNVSYVSSNLDVAIVTNNIVTITGAGTTTITASQIGNENYNAASDVSYELTVSKLDQIISFEILSPKNTGDADFNLTAISSSGLPISYTSSNTAVATTNNNIVTIVGVGTTSITAMQIGNENYNAATSILQDLIISGTSTGIDYIQTKNIELFPNPCSDNLHIQSNLTQTGNCKVNIYSIQGVLINTQILNKNNTIILSIADLVSGTYIIEIFKNNELLIRDRLIKIL